MEANELVELLKTSAVQEQIKAITKGTVDNAVRDQLTADQLHTTLQHEGVIQNLRKILGDATANKNAETAMHYGNLRFAVYSASVLIIGGMLGMFLSEDYHKAFLSGNVRYYFAWAGFGMAFCLGVAQLRINEMLFFYQKAATDAGTIGKPNSMDFWKWVARFIMLAPYVAAMVCWMLLLYRSELFEGAN